MTAHNLRQLAPEDAIEVLDRMFARSPFGDQRMQRLAPRVRTHLGAYVESLARWEGWEPASFESADSDDPDLRWRAVWERPGDGAVAADFVGYVQDPVDIHRPGRAFSVFSRDATTCYRQLVNEFGDVRFKGLRLWIVGADERPVVRWLTHDNTGQESADQG